MNKAKKFVVKKQRQLKAYKATFKAGWIAENCESCRIDDESEEIISCLWHTAEIARLSKISLENWED